ncbi:type II secretion system F family protein [Streptomyces roseirectus]|uniref:Type II secretion system F family protein n=1 Tax=Streptomyces roseirectus TaxID=2768066 RepID=A0A7H0IQB1_9ACTN|nr:type II secretion system F family protein [Streptomyces roseirectus]QNP74977.1 type II secretion system F family protein [Streptomyces roseirectus]
MTATAPVMGLLGLGVGCGLLLLIRAWRLPAKPARRRAPRRHAGRWLAAAVGAGLLAWAVTGWVAGGLLVGMAVWNLPHLLGTGAGERGRTVRIEAVAGWTEMLRDTLAAAAGLEQTITATASAAPEAIRPQVTELAARLERGEHLVDALHRLADELEDPTADLVIAALVLSAQHQARQLAPLLGELAATARAQVEMRRRVEAGRARVRTTQRTVVGTTFTFITGLVLFNPAFLTPYDTAAGQVVLLMIGALFTLAFVWLRRMARIEEPERFFTTTKPSTAAGEGVVG